ncbi:MAG: HEAT repeat domain-containing protein, partial [Planctomycetota bacterium]
GERQAVPLLLEILANSEDGRRLLRSNQDIHDVHRALAAAALGTLSDPQAIPALLQIVGETPDSSVELKAGAILALGLFQEGQFEIVPFLLELLADRRLSELMQAQIPVALSRMGDAARPVLPHLLKMAESRKTRNLVRESCIIALGKLAAPEDMEIVKALTRLAEKSNDEASSNFAFVALGEIGCRAALDMERHGEMLDGLTRFLLRSLTRPQRKSQTAWAATGCALLGRGYEPTSDARQLIISKLARTWQETRSPTEQGALTICLGLVEARAMGDELLEALKESGDRSQKGYLAESLGLMRHEAAAEELLDALRNDNDPIYRAQVATGLGLMGNLEVSGLLVKELSRARTLFDTSAVAKALGSVGDRTAIEPLLELVQARSRPGLARAFGAVALGLIGEKTPLPWNSRVSVGANYMAAFYTQTEIMDIL